MLGSFFDLEKEVASIAARRAGVAPPPAVADRAFDDFDRTLRDFLQSVTPAATADPSRQIRIDRDRPVR